MDKIFISKCQLCSKLATMRCFDCFKETGQTKELCFICDNSIHKVGSARNHRKERINYRLDAERNEQISREQSLHQNQRPHNFKAQMFDDKNQEEQYEDQQEKQSAQFYKNEFYAEGQGSILHQYQEEEPVELNQEYDNKEGNGDDKYHFENNKQNRSSSQDFGNDTYVNKREMRTTDEQIEIYKNNYNKGEEELKEKEDEVLKRIQEIKQKMKDHKSKQSAEKYENDILTERMDLKNTNQTKLRPPQRENSLKRETSIHQSIHLSQPQMGRQPLSIQQLEQNLKEVSQLEDKRYAEGIKKVFEQELKNTEIKYKIRISELENINSYLRQHIDHLEQRCEEIKSKHSLDQDKKLREVNEKERISTTLLQKEVDRLLLQLQEEKKSYFNLELKMQDLEQQYHFKVLEIETKSKKSYLQNETQKMKMEEWSQEVEAKVEVMRKQIEAANEKLLCQMKEDYEIIIDEQKQILENKNQQIQQLSEQRSKDLSKHQKECKKLKKKIIESQRKESFNQSDQGVLSELDLAKKETELLYEQKQYLFLENQKLAHQIEKFEKMLYGGRREKAILSQLKTNQSNRPSSASY